MAVTKKGNRSTNKSTSPKASTKSQKKTTHSHSEEYIAKSINSSKPTASVTTDMGQSKKSMIVKWLSWIAAFVLCFILVDFAVQYLNNDYSVAVVNNYRIPKSEFYRRLENSFGKQIADELIEDQLIKGEASKNKVTVTEKEVDEKVAEIENSIGGKEQLDATLKSNNLTIEELRNNIKNDILTRKLLEPTIEVKEDELKAFFEQYKTLLYPDDPNVEYESKKDDVRQKYITYLVSQKKVTWLEDLKLKANIQNNTQDKPSYGFLKVTTNIVTNIYNSIQEKVQGQPAK